MPIGIKVYFIEFRQEYEWFLVPLPLRIQFVKILTV